MKINSNVKAGSLTMNHTQTVRKGLRIKSGIKSGVCRFPCQDGDPNHNQTVKGLRVKSKVKAGADGLTMNHNQTVAR